MNQRKNKLANQSTGRDSWVTGKIVTSRTGLEVTLLSDKNRKTPSFTGRTRAKERVKRPIQPGSASKEREAVHEESSPAPAEEPTRNINPSVDEDLQVDAPAHQLEDKPDDTPADRRDDDLDERSDVASNIDRQRSTDSDADEPESVHQTRSETPPASVVTRPSGGLNPLALSQVHGENSLFDSRKRDQELAEQRHREEQRTAEKKALEEAERTLKEQNARLEAEEIKALQDQQQEISQKVQEIQNYAAQSIGALNHNAMPEDIRLRLMYHANALIGSDLTRFSSRLQTFESELLTLQANNEEPTKTLIDGLALEFSKVWMHPDDVKFLHAQEIQDNINQLFQLAASLNVSLAANTQVVNDINSAVSSAIAGLNKTLLKQNLDNEFTEALSTIHRLVDQELNGSNLADASRTDISTHRVNELLAMADIVNDFYQRQQKMSAPEKDEMLEQLEKLGVNSIKYSKNALQPLKAATAAGLGGPAAAALSVVAPIVGVGAITIGTVDILRQSERQRQANALQDELLKRTLLERFERREGRSGKSVGGATLAVMAATISLVGASAVVPPILAAGAAAVGVHLAAEKLIGAIRSQGRERIQLKRQIIELLSSNSVSHEEKTKIFSLFRIQPNDSVSQMSDKIEAVIKTWQ